MNMEPTLPTDEDCAKGTRDWPHAPPHRLASAGVYIVTARTAEARHLPAADGMKDWFQDKVHELAQEFGGKLHPSADLPSATALCASERRASQTGWNRIRLEMVQCSRLQTSRDSCVAEDDYQFQIRRDRHEGR